MHTMMNATVSEKPEAGKGKVLVMDDDKIIRMISVFLLNQLGYCAEAAVNGEEAISLFEREKKAGTPYDAVILDIRVAGGMGGEETIRHLLKIDSGIRAIVSSGYHRDPLMLECRRFGFAGVLPKPYGLEQMEQVMAAAFENDACANRERKSFRRKEMTSDEKKERVLEVLRGMIPGEGADSLPDLKCAVGRQMRITPREVENLAAGILRSGGATTPLQLHLMKTVLEHI